MKVLVIGLNPSKLGGNSPSLKRLYEWLDILELKIVSFTNIYRDYEISKTSSDVSSIMEFSKNYDKIITLGTVASKTLSDLGIDHASLPHPSGLNRQLNNKQFIQKQLKSCKNYLQGD